MKVIKFLFIVLIIALVGLVVFRNVIAQNVLGGITKQLTGLDIKTESINLGIFDSSLGVKGFQLLNPEGFQKKVMIDLPEFFVDFNLKALLFEKKIHLSKARLDLQEILIERNENKEFNLEKLQQKAAQVTKKTPSQAPSSKGESQDKGKSKNIEFQIDELQLALGKVVYKDYSQSPASVKEFNINIKEKLENITDFNTLVQLIIAKALANTNLLGLFKFDDLQKSFNQSVEKSKQELEAAAQETQAAAEEKIEKAKEEVGKTLDDLQNKFKTGLGTE